MGLSSEKFTDNSCGALLVCVAAYIDMDDVCRPN